ncbi:hypothetical protein C8F04DRAFT_1204931, partial [Mycena alexandri]
MQGRKLSKFTGEGMDWVLHMGRSIYSIPGFPTILREMTTLFVDHPKASATLLIAADEQPSKGLCCPLSWAVIDALQQYYKLSMLMPRRVMNVPTQSQGPPQPAYPYAAPPAAPSKPRGSLVSPYEHERTARASPPAPPIAALPAASSPAPSNGSSLDRSAVSTPPARRPSPPPPPQQHKHEPQHQQHAPPPPPHILAAARQRTPPVPPTPSSPAPPDITAT